jgi:hypothetical protein
MRPAMTLTSKKVRARDISVERMTMLKKLGQWLATNRFVAAVVIVGSIVGALGFFLTLHVKFSEAFKILWPRNYDYPFWQQSLISIAGLAFLIATLEGLSGCVRSHALTLEAWWPRVRSGLAAASVPVWLSWLDRVSPAAHSKFVWVIESLRRPGAMLLYVFTIALVAWIFIFHVIVPAGQAFGEASGEK